MGKKQMTQNIGVLMSDSHGNGNQFLGQTRPY